MMARDAAAPRAGRHLTAPETWKASKDPCYAAEKARAGHLYAIAERQGQGARPGVAAADARHLYPHRRVRHLLAAYELGEDKLYGHIKPCKTRARFLEFCRYLRSLYPAATAIAIVCDNFSPHLITRKDGRAGTRANVA
jgi:hypothetical protein